MHVFIDTHDRLGIEDLGLTFRKWGISILTGLTGRTLALSGISIKIASSDLSLYTDAIKNGKSEIYFVVANMWNPKEAAGESTTLEAANHWFQPDLQALIFAAARRVRDITVIVDPADYPLVIAEMDNNHGKTTLSLRTKLSGKAILYAEKYEREKLQIALNLI
jgi:AICAR transformylase/IMP cyclohydrolase PurH